MIHNRFFETDKSKARGGENTKNRENKELICEEKLYRDSKGNTFIPSSHIEGTMQKAASQFKMEGAGKKTYKDLVRGAVFVFPEFVPLKSKWMVDERSVVVPATRGRIMCYRPRFDKWDAEFTIDVSDDRADASTIEEILKYAGAYIGIGTYRPRFGRFEVVEFKQVK